MIKLKLLWNSKRPERKMEERKHFVCTFFASAQKERKSNKYRYKSGAEVDKILYIERDNPMCIMLNFNFITKLEDSFSKYIYRNIH